ncbi:hypothetical protein SUGI_1008840 [Cryptomeria japonica]|nr:hypothetical protein SUGI_1008840 [Cryptomeria japonica]
MEEYLLTNIQELSTLKDAKTKVDKLTEAHEIFRKLELEVKKFSERLGHLQEDIEMKNAQANIAVQYAHSLEIKLADLNELHERVELQRGELAKLEADCLALKIELEGKHNAVSQLEERVMDSSL